MKTKKMMPWEFKHYLADHMPNSVRYDYEDQKWFDLYGFDPTFSASFRKIDVGINPTRIRLFDTTTHNYICFEDVKYVQVESQNGANCRKFYIYCTSPRKENMCQTRRYTLLAE